MRGVEEVARGSVWIEGADPRSCDYRDCFVILARRWVVLTTCDTWAGMPIAGFSSGSVGN